MNLHVRIAILIVIRIGCVTVSSRFTKQGKLMTDEISELYGVPEITADGISRVHIVAGLVRLVFWEWQIGPNGSLQRVLSGRLRITKEGLICSRPMISAVLTAADPQHRMIGGQEAHGSH